MSADAQLLSAFVRDRSESAFRELVWLSHIGRCIVLCRFCLVRGRALACCHIDAGNLPALFHPSKFTRDL
jgi:hypothetical protein